MKWRQKSSKTRIWRANPHPAGISRNDEHHYHLRSHLSLNGRQSFPKTFNGPVYVAFQPLGLAQFDVKAGITRIGRTGQRVFWLYLL